MVAITLRAKRLKQVYFVSADTSDTVLALKGKLAKMVGGGKEAATIRLQVPAKTEQGKFNVLEDPAVLEQLGIADDAVVYFIYSIDGTPDGNWEPVQIIEFESLNDDGDETVDLKGKGHA
ncbi:hypothetical protein CcCBS67573_g00461 [Chytriomyces confervae]|uniref:Ubiquitin-like domain-containing protein n=1 Tax=Chytriomyces confervae TaxID=246404 RepID=A0A507FP99_9FUNG|nr:hypothetical protein HDU80_005095 [Chytriomyces hyalinus]TPX78249.1 hypothetical protein CcCBS67573_g00461 [Chytriomyces confervae]